MESSAKREIIEMLLGAVVARAIYAAAEIGVADLLYEKAMDAGELAERLAVDKQSLFRLLRMLTSHGVFELDGNGLFSLTSLGHCLRSEGPSSLRDFILQEDETRWRSVGRLKDAVVKGSPSFDQIFGKNYFEYLAGDQKMNSRFEAGMSSLTVEEDDQIAEALDTSGAGTLVDVGGGRGGFIAKVLSRNPALKGILFELPHVVFPRDDLLLNGMEHRCSLISGSFLESVPKGGDIYTLKRVLHDWDDHTSLTILKNCRDSMQNGGRIIVVEAVVPPGNRSHIIKDIDVYMMALFPGRERTAEEFGHLFEKAGLQLTGIRQTKSDLALIEGVAV